MVNRNQVFTVYDSKIGLYRHPFIMRAKGEALRSFIDIVNDDKNEIGKHPEDFTLFHIGEYDEEKGRYNNFETPISCGVGVEYVKVKNNE